MTKEVTFSRAHPAFAPGGAATIEFADTKSNRRLRVRLTQHALRNLAQGVIGLCEIQDLMERCGEAERVTAVESNDNKPTA